MSEMIMSDNGSSTSAVKSLFRPYLKDFKSSHLSEALAAACGYATHAAYTADLKYPELISFYAVNCLDAARFADRLSQLSGVDRYRVRESVVSAFEGICEDSLLGRGVPIGPSSDLDESVHQLVLPVLETSDDDDEIRSSVALEHALGLAGDECPLWFDRTILLLSAVANSLSGIDQKIPEVDSVRTHLEIEELFKLTEPSPESTALSDYLTSMPEYEPTAGSRQSRTFIEQHNHARDIALALMEGLRGWFFLSTAYQGRPYLIELTESERAKILKDTTGGVSSLFGSFDDMELHDSDQPRHFSGKEVANMMLDAGFRLKPTTSAKSLPFIGIGIKWGSRRTLH